MDKIFVRGDVLLQIYLPHNPPLTLVSSANLKKLVVYAKTRGGFPNLGRDLWMFVAKEKYSLDSQLASLYFDLFLSVCDQKCKEGDYVPLAPFAVYLGFHAINFIRTKRAWAMDESAPLENSMSESRIDPETYLKCDAENDVLTCIRDKIPHFVQVIGLCFGDCENYKLVDQTLILRVKRDVILALDYFFETISADRKVVPISGVILGEKRAEFVSEQTSEINVSHVCSYLQKFLKSDPFYLLATIPFRISIVGGIRDSIIGRRKRTAYLGKSSEKEASRRIIVAAFINKRHLRKVSDLMQGSILKLLRCNEAYMYFLNSYCCAVVDSCKGCRIVVAVVGGTVRVDSCTNCTFHLVCQRLIVSHCTGCTFYVQSAAAPVLVNESNSDLTFAPANCWFPFLSDLALQSNIPLTTSWNKPISLKLYESSKRNGTGLDKQSDQFSIMPPESFFVFEPPFKDPQSNEKWERLDEWLPVEYAEMCRIRASQARDTEKKLSLAAFSSGKEFYGKLMKQCDEWLAKNGYKHEMETLRIESKSKQKY